jgi:hypothetical protein
MIVNRFDAVAEGIEHGRCGSVEKQQVLFDV